MHIDRVSEREGSFPDVTQQDSSRVDPGPWVFGVPGTSFNSQGTRRRTQGSRNPGLGPSRAGVSSGPGILINLPTSEKVVFLRGTMRAFGDSRAPGTGTPREPWAVECRLCPASSQKNSLSWQSPGDVFPAARLGRAGLPGSLGSPWGCWRGPKARCHRGVSPGLARHCH